MGYSGLFGIGASCGSGRPELSRSNILWLVNSTSHVEIMSSAHVGTLVSPMAAVWCWQGRSWRRRNLHGLSKLVGARWPGARLGTWWWIHMMELTVASSASTAVRAPQLHELAVAEVDHLH